MATKTTTKKKSKTANSAGLPCASDYEDWQINEAKLKLLREQRGAVAERLRQLEADIAAGREQAEDDQWAAEQLRETGEIPRWDERQQRESVGKLRRELRVCDLAIKQQQDDCSRLLRRNSSDAVSRVRPQYDDIGKQAIMHLIELAKLARKQRRIDTHLEGEGFGGLQVLPRLPLVKIVGFLGTESQGRITEFLKIAVSAGWLTAAEAEQLKQGG